MSELEDFEHFKKYSLHKVNYETGQIDSHAFRPIGKYNSFPIVGTYLAITENIGSKNEDGYERVVINKHLRMKHRLIYWLFYGELPEEIDHIDKDRSNNSINNLRSVNRLTNCTGITYKGRKKFSTEELHEICNLIKQGISDTKIAKQYNCTRTAIMGIRKKKRHKDIADSYF